MLNKKLFAFDVDGTLLNDDKNVLDSTKKAINLLVEKGHVVCLSTGRTPIQTIDIVNELNLKHFVIGSGGAVVYNIQTKTSELLCENLSKKDIKVMWNFAKKLKRELSFNDGNQFCRIYFGNDPSTEIKDELFFRGGTSKKPIYDPKKEAKKFLKNKKIIQCSLKMESNKIIEFNEAIRSKLSKLVDIHITSRVYFEIAPLNINKFNAIKKIAEKLNINEKNIYCFGDSHNDLEMIKYSANGVAMGNAIQEIKDVAKHVIGNNNTDSIYNFLLEKKII